MNLPKDVEFIIDKIEKNNFEAYLVGGCVRDFLLNKVPNDYDLTTNAKPDEIINIFKDFKLVLNGIKHGTVGVIIDKKVYEITTYRVEKEYKDFRRPSEIVFSDDIKEDLKRRDFTINAMAYNKKLIDLFGGKNDLSKKIIKTVGDSNKRFNEDALRIIRAIRFSAKLGFDIECETLKSIYKNANLIKNISIERISDEICKIIISENLSNLILFFDAKLFFYIGINYEINQNNYKNMCCEFNFINKFETLEQKLIAFEYIVLKNYEKTNDFSCLLTQKLILPKNLKNKVFLTLELCKADFNNLSKISLKKLLNKYEKEVVYNFLDLNIKYFEFKENFEKLKTFESYKVLTDEIINNKECYKIKDLKINGNDLKSMGYSGVDIKLKLEYLLDFVIENNDKNNKKDLINKLKC